MPRSLEEHLNEIEENDRIPLTRAIQFLQDNQVEIIRNPVSTLQRLLRLGYNQGLRVAQHLERLQLWTLYNDAKDGRVAIIQFDNINGLLMTDIQPNSSPGNPNKPSIKEVVELQKTAFNALTLVNGGAVVAILTLVGNIVGKADDITKYINFHYVRYSLGSFAGGLFFSVVATVAALFWAHAETQTLPASVCVYRLSVRAYVYLFVISLLCFVAGSICAMLAFVHS